MISLNRYLDVSIKKPIKLQGKINPSFKCKICEDLMFNPVVTVCEEVACKMCYEEKKINGVCPLEGEECDGETCSFFLDKFRIKEILKMEVHCPNEQCEWKGKLSELREEHFVQCKEVLRELCYEEFNKLKRKLHMDKHFDQCKEVLQTCELFYEEVNKLKVKLHMDEKHRDTECCIYGCKQLVTGGSLADHMKPCEMIKTQAVCPLQHMGCQVQVDYHIGNHLATSGYDHLVLLVSKNHELENKVKELTEKVQVLEETIKGMSTKQEGEIKIFREESTNSREALQKEFKTSLESVRKQQQLLENTNYTGDFTWKISNYNDRLAAAQNNTVPALHSAPCYVERFNYRFCLRAYLNGDGDGKGSFLSLFIVIMRSEYDDLLAWPFQNKVTFRLRAKRPRQDYEESFLPNHSSVCFQRPTKEMNVAAGSPKFMKQDLVTQNYVINNSLYIQVKVEQ